MLDDLQIQWIKYARSLEGAHVPLPVGCRRELDTNLSATGASDYDPMIPKDYPLFGTVVGNAHYQRDGFHAERGATFGFAIEGEHRKEPVLLAPAWGRLRP